ncbi:MAG: diguanylate cyclase [Dehalococcoidia bacterium]|jgi:diguanylate cyclase (GGDEF)-like protein|nr:diguanylate cyclase [Dehalococcoidia bacterium]
MNRISSVLRSWQIGLGEGLRGALVFRGVAFMLGVLVVLRVATLVNPDYSLGPVAGVLGGAIILQFVCYFLLRQERLLSHLSWLLLVTDILIITLLVYFTGGVESIFIWAYLVVILWWGYMARLKGAVTAGALSLVAFWLFTGLELGGALPHYQLLPLEESFYEDTSLVGAIIAVYSLAIPLVIWIGTYLSTRRQMESTRRGYLEGVRAFVEAVEAKDPHTKGHSERVARYAVLISQELGLKKKEIELIRQAGLIYDVGKIFLPEDVLTARGELEPAQQAAMMSHPLLSYEVLEKTGAPEDILLAVRHHHEWYGGGGYPDGLRGQDIPLAACILAVADAFEAMTAGRFYRARRSIEEAAGELSRGKGTQFDPKVVDAFLKRLEKEKVPTRLPEEVPAPAEKEEVKVPLARRELPWTLGMMTTTQYKASTILFRLGQEVRSILDRSTIQSKVLSLLREVQSYDNCALFIREESGELVMQAAIGYRIHQRGARVAKEEGVIGWVAEHGVVRMIPDVTTNSSYLESSFLRSGAMLVVPLATEGKVVAVLVVENELPDAFSMEDVRLAEAIGPYIAAVIEVALLHEQVKSAASYDSLTGVYNHRYFYERLGQEMSHSQRHGHPLSIVIIDVDALKKINDLHGHLAGDEALRRIGRLLKENVRAADVVARYGGDEFAIIMPETDKEEAEKVIARLMLVLDESTVEYGELSFPMPSRSHGVATFPWNGNNSTELFAVADAHLYEEKGGKAASA